ncbi:MAG: hypothetical protein ACREN8_02705, partial [Candidatus Dormibacteraceae bacterium]
HQQRIIEPLGELYHNQGRSQPPTRLELWKDAVATVVHESCHLLSPPGHHLVEGRAIGDQPSTAFLEEGVAELYTHNRLNQLIRAAGLERAAPGLCRVRAQVAYPEYLPAVRLLLQWVGKRIGLGYPKVLQQLVEQTPAGKYSHLAELILAHTGLRERIPLKSSWAAKRTLENQLRSVFDQVILIPPGLGGTARQGFSHRLGTQAVEGLSQAISQLERDSRASALDRSLLINGR